jgi:hypothetical protein
MHAGRCLCGAVRVEVAGALTAPDACHCSMCRRQSGHYWASSSIPRGALSVEGEDHVRWYRSSQDVERGFCITCGSMLFWSKMADSNVSVAMGLFAAPTATSLRAHLFVADKGDYYVLADGVPQRSGA